MRGAWVRGAWCVVRGAWCVVRGAWCAVGGCGGKTHTQIVTKRSRVLCGSIFEEPDLKTSYRGTTTTTKTATIKTKTKHQQPNIGTTKEPESRSGYVQTKIHAASIRYEPL